MGGRLCEWRRRPPDRPRGDPPAVGIARVGNSARASSSGPRCPARCRTRRRVQGRQRRGRRQAARFRVYGLDADGLPVRELTAAEADITWRVNVANSKAAWYDFDTPFDIPDAQPADPRNDDVRERDRG